MGIFWRVGFDFPGKQSVIVKELKRETVTITRLVEEGEHKTEIERKEWETDSTDALQWLAAWKGLFISGSMVIFHQHP